MADQKSNPEDKCRDLFFQLDEQSRHPVVIVKEPDDKGKDHDILMSTCYECIMKERDDGQGGLICKKDEYDFIMLPFDKTIESRCSDCKKEV